MTWLFLVAAALCVWFAWESLLSLSPWPIPAAVQPFLVAGAALALTWPDWMYAGAAAGLVLLLHTALGRVRVEGQTVQVPPGVGQRVPRLP